MFNRVELKNNAKRFLSKNYWWVVLVTIILSIASGSFSIGNNSITTRINTDSITNYGTMNDFDYSDMMNGTDGFFENFGATYSQIYHQIYGQIREMFASIPTGALIGIGYMIFVIFIISLAVSIFLLSPLIVGCRRWYLLNRTAKPDIGEVAHVFKNGYMNTVKTMFLQDLFISLWSLLFVIPGIVKSYEYRMIPYLLAENPNMDWHEAFDRSRAMMKGNKWDTFVLDLSFLGWQLLAAFTCGLLSIFYVAPYMALTNAELYVKLCQNSNGTSYGNQTDNRNPYDDTYNNGYQNPY